VGGTLPLSGARSFPAWHPCRQASAEVAPRGSNEARGPHGAGPPYTKNSAGLIPRPAQRIHPNDPQRIQRALEVCLTTGRRISELQRTGVSALGALSVLRRWALVPADRTLLQARLEERFNAMDGAWLFSARSNPCTAAATWTRDLPGPARARLPPAVGAPRRGRSLSAKRSSAHRRNAPCSPKRQLTWIRADATLEHVNPHTPRAFEDWNLQLAKRVIHALGA